MEEFSNVCERRRQQIDKMFDYLVDNLGTDDVKAMLLFLCDLQEYFDDLRSFRPFHSLDEKDTQVAQFFQFMAQYQNDCVWNEPFACFMIYQTMMDQSITKDKLEHCLQQTADR